MAAVHHSLAAWGLLRPVIVFYEWSFPNHVFSFHSLMLYYFRSMTKSHLHMIEMLKDQLVLVCRFIVLHDRLSL